MLPWNPAHWTEEYILSTYVGLPESAHLEYKSGRSLENKENRDRFVREQLSRTISAFANSSGGIILIGVDEDRRTRVATRLDGVVIGKEAAFESREQFQQIVETCINPPLSGIRIRQVPISQPSGGFVLVVYVPQGATAYQAKDHIYYSRSEFESKPMPDHEVRLRMLRGHIAEARLELGDVRFTTADQDLLDRAKKRDQIKKEREAGLFVRREREEFLLGDAVNLDPQRLLVKRDYDLMTFNCYVVNSGEFTLRDFSLSIGFLANNPQTRIFAASIHMSYPSGIDQLKSVTGRERYRFAEGIRKETWTGTQEFTPPPKKLFPGDKCKFPDNEGWGIALPIELPLKKGDCLLQWKIYLDDAPGNSGEIDLSEIWGPNTAN